MRGTGGRSSRLAGPVPDQWKGFLGTWTPPSPFFAVPHHVERHMMEWLVSKTPGLVLDRLRLVRFKQENNAAEREIIQAVIGQEVEPLAG